MKNGFILTCDTLNYTLAFWSSTTNATRRKAMTAHEVVKELKAKGSPSIKKVLMAHGAKEPFFGVKVEELKKIQKRVKKDHALALALYDTGVSDAMYLAGLIADDAKMTKKDLQRWVEKA